jgi:Flp pilus assembly protein TadB
MFNEVLLEAALFVAALSVMYRTTQHNQHSDQKMERINDKNEKHSIIQVKDQSMKKTAHNYKNNLQKTAHKLFVLES